MYDPRDDPVNTFMSKWYKGPARQFVTNTMGTDHIPESNFSYAMQFREKERTEHKQMSDLVLQQRTEIDESNSWLTKLTAALNTQTDKNSELQLQNNELRSAARTHDSSDVSGSVGVFKAEDTSGPGDGGVVGDVGGRPDSASNERETELGTARGVADGVDPEGGESKSEGED